VAASSGDGGSAGGGSAMTGSVTACAGKEILDDESSGLLLG
jgi:hypothetical protein